MDLLPVEMKVEVFIRLKYRDRMTCRRVCLQWKNIVDDVVGLPVKITQTNMKSLFNSKMLVRTPVVSIKPGPAVCRWNGCPFSPIFLKSVYLKTKISAENWNLILKHCSALEELVFTLSGKKHHSHRDRYFRNAEKDPEVQYLVPTTHYNLKRIMIRNISRPDDFKISTLLDSLTCPKLKQCFFSVGYSMIITLPFGFSKFQKSVTSFVTKSQKCHILALYSSDLAMKPFCAAEKESCYRQLHVKDNLVENWQKLAAYYDYQFNSLSGFVFGYTFETLIYQIMQNSNLTLKFLNLEFEVGTNVHCGHLSRFTNLQSLTITGPSVVECVNMMSETITMISLDVPPSVENLDDILFLFPQLLTLHLLHDFMPATLTGYHLEAAKAHPRLQTMIITPNSLKLWINLELESGKSGHGKCWTGLKANDGGTALRAVVFNDRMTNESWNWVFQNFQCF